MSRARGRAMCLTESTPTLPAGRGLRFLKGSVCACAPALVGINEALHLLSIVKWSLVYVGVVCVHGSPSVSLSCTSVMCKWVSLCF